MNEWFQTANQGRLHRFVAESNRIEGMYKVTEDDLVAHERVLSLDRLNVRDLIDFVAAVQKGAVLRDQPGMDVTVGGHEPPPGGLGIEPALIAILADAADVDTDPWTVHCDYEALHPFTDGNGRSGRVLWLWQMTRYRSRDMIPPLGFSRDMIPPLGFLHTAYYQALSNYEGRR